MNIPLKKPFNVLDKAKSESMSDKDFEVFNRVEKRMARYSKAKMKVFMSQFQSAAWDMSFIELFQEKHSSYKLGKHLRIMKQPRPGANWEAHHIVSGDHKEAIPSREVLADDGIKIRIDDPDNGCWMPKTKADARPTIYPNAIGHNRIHRQLYYDWIYRVIEPMQTDGQVRAFLNTVRAQLLHGNIKPEMKLQQEIDGAEYESWLKKKRKL
jgi:hypothetical protein